jgi:hypothetical protein
VTCRRWVYYTTTIVTVRGNVGGDDNGREKCNAV